MDPVAIAFIGALTFGVAQGTAEVGKRAVIDAYDGLKGLIRRKFGTTSGIVEAVERLENKPESKGQQQVLTEEVEAVKASQDPEVRQAAEALLAKLKEQPGGVQHIQHIQTAVGSYIAQASHGSTASVNVSGDKRQDK